MVGERWLSSGLGGSWRGGVSGRTFSPAGGVRSEEALELAEATEKADSREEMFEEMPERRSLEVWSADRRRVRRNPPPLSFVVAVILQPATSNKTDVTPLRAKPRSRKLISLQVCNSFGL